VDVSSVVVENVMDGEDEDVDVGLASSASPQHATATTGVGTPLRTGAPSLPSLSPHPPTPGSMLSPSADPFYPSLGGSSKHHRWADEDSDESDGDHPSTYLEATLHPAKSATVLPVRTQPTAALGCSGADVG
jgi:hypothetical protein